MTSKSQSLCKSQVVISFKFGNSESKSSYLGCYALLMLGVLVLHSKPGLPAVSEPHSAPHPGAFWFQFTWGIIRTSRVIHELLIASVMSTTLRFFDTTPMGRITARFTKDIRVVDGTVSNELQMMLSYSAFLLVRLGAIVYFSPVFVWPGLAFGVAGYILGNFYIAAQLSVKRYVPISSDLNFTVSELTIDTFCRSGK